MLGNSQEMGRLPTGLEWEEWTKHPAAALFARYLRRKQEELQQEWAKGTFGDQVHYETVVLNSKAQGIHQCIDQILDLEYEQVVGELRDGN